MKNKIILATGLLLSLSAQAAVIDGDWRDWIAPSGSGSADDWQPVVAGTKYAVEDQAGGLATYLDPGYGGQAYDAEAIYVATTGTAIQVAVITGKAPDNTYPWGDIAIDFGNDGVFEYALVTRGDAWGIGNAGEVYAASDWNLGLWSAPGVYDPSPDSDYARRHPTSVADGELLGDGAFAWSKMDVPVGTLGGDHWFMEASIPLNLLDASLFSQPFTAHWTMGCANDWIEVDPVLVPEPLTGGLLGLGLLGLMGLSRRARAGSRG